MPTVLLGGSGTLAVALGQMYDTPAVTYDQAGVLYNGAGDAPAVVLVPAPFVPVPAALSLPTTDVQIRIPFGVSGTGGIAYADDIAEIDKMNVITLIGTQPGERAMRPSYGVATRDLLFENDNPALTQVITIDIQDAVVAYAPEIVITDVGIGSNDPTDGRVDIVVEYRTSDARLDTSSDSISTTVADGS